MSKQKLSSIKKIVVHCTSTLPNQPAGFKECYQWHVVEKDWSNVGYHYGIEQCGNIWQGRVIDFEKGTTDIGAHAVGFNTGSLGIVLSGGCSDIYENEDGHTVYEAADNFTEIQKVNLAALIKKLIEKCQAAGAGDIEVIGHNQLDPSKDCPSFDVKAWWAEQST